MTDRPRPVPTTMPGPGEPRDRAPLPPARVHGARAVPRLGVVIALLLVASCVSFGTLLSRIDTARAEAATARADAQRAFAHVLVLEARIEQFTHRDVKPPNVIDEVCRRRTVALRGALLALVRTGAVSMTGDPGTEWITWR
jgi:hypothetical protein